MTKEEIDERIAQLVRVKHYASPRHYETLDAAISAMRKCHEIEKIIHDIPYGGQAVVWKIQEVLEDE